MATTAQDLYPIRRTGNRDQELDQVNALFGKLIDFIGSIPSSQDPISDKANILITSASVTVDGTTEPNTIIYCTSGSPVTITLDDAGVGTVVRVIQVGDGSVTILPSGSLNILSKVGSSPRITAKLSIITCVQHASSEWSVFGEINSRAFT